MKRALNNRILPARSDAERRVASLRRRQLELARAGQVRASAAIARRLRRKPNGEWDLEQATPAGDDMAEGATNAEGGCRPRRYLCAVC